MVLAPLGLRDAVVAVAADMGVSLLVTLNGLRLLRLRSETRVRPRRLDAGPRGPRWSRRHRPGSLRRRMLHARATAQPLPLTLPLATPPRSSCDDGCTCCSGDDDAVGRRADVATLALVLYVVYLALAFGARTVL